MPRQTEYDISQAKTDTQMRTRVMQNADGYASRNPRGTATQTGSPVGASPRSDRRASGSVRTSAQEATAYRTSESGSAQRRARPTAQTNAAATATRSRTANGSAAQRTSRTSGHPSAARPARRNRKKRRNFKRLFARMGAWAALIVTASAVLAAATMGVLLISVRGISPKKSDLTYQIGTDTDIYRSAKVKYDSMYRGGVLYFNLSELADYCDLVITGTAQEIRFISRASETDNARLIIGTPLAYINNNPVRLNAPFLYENNEVYVPETFLRYYMSGLTVQTEGQKVTVARVVEREEPPTLTVQGQTQATVIYQTVGFALHESPSPGHIAESDIDRLNPLPAANS